MDTTGILVTAKLTLSDDTETSKCKQAIARFCEAMQQEPGCNFAIMSQTLTSDRSFILWESYKDEDAIQAHFDAPHTQAFIKSAITSLEFASQSFIGQGNDTI